MITAGAKRKATPGPWFLNGPYHIQAPNADGHTVVVAQVVKGTTITLEQMEANSDLLASAPELLEALEYAAETIRIARQYFPNSIRNHDSFRLENTCATIDKAIHKAKGEL